MVNNKKYAFSFTGASVLFPETLTIAEIYFKSHDWEKTKTKIIEGNLLNKIKGATFEREFRELKKRINVLSQQQLNILCHGDKDEALALVLLSIFKTYTFLFDFSVEVLRNKLLQFDHSLTETDYNKFISVKSNTHNELNDLTELTLDKIKQRTFTIFEQTGLLNNLKDKIIIRPHISERVYVSIVEDDINYLRGFMFSDSELKSVVNLISK